MIQRLIGVFSQAFSRLDIRVGPDRLEDLAVLIHKAMTVQARHYHNLEHVFSFVEPDNPIQTLAGLFHDIVYYQVDLGFLPEIRRIVIPYIREQDGVISLSRQLPSADRLFWITLELFDLQNRAASITLPGSIPSPEYTAPLVITPEMGVNEFLSAVVMNAKLSRIVPEKELFKMTLCVEATIPFRGSLPSGEGHFDVLAARAGVVSKRWRLVFTPEEINEAVCGAVRFANRDVEGFAEQDPGKFLQGTWKLLPEMNIPLRSKDVYSIREYRQALQSMDTSLGMINPANVFHTYQGTPAVEEFQIMSERARRNIDTAREYLRIKLLAQAILEALAMETGGDAPLSLFMGDLPRASESVQRMEDFLPDLPPPDWIDQQFIVYQLLDSGRNADVNFDLTTAPLSAFVYKSLRPEQIDRSLALAEEMFAGHILPEDFLAQVDSGLIQQIARASAAMVPTRSQQLGKYFNPA